MRALVTLSLFTLMACGSTEPSSSSNVAGPIADASTGDTPGSSGGDASLEVSDAPGETTVPSELDTGGAALDALTLDALDSDALDAGDVFASVESHVLVIGLGAVGSYVAGVLRAMGSRVVATRRTLTEEKKQER